MTPQDASPRASLLGRMHPTGRQPTRQSVRTHAPHRTPAHTPGCSDACTPQDTSPCTRPVGRMHAAGCRNAMSTHVLEPPLDKVVHTAVLGAPTPPSPNSRLLPPLLGSCKSTLRMPPTPASH
eukprot:364789-Chlamydomonas_euryale.AAC.7